MAFKLLELFYHRPEGETGRWDWLTPGLWPELERLPELRQPRWSPSPSLPRQCPSGRAGGQGTGSAAAPGPSGREPGLRFPAFVAAKITSHTRSLNKLRSWQEAWNNGSEKCELCPSNVIPERPDNNAFSARQYELLHDEPCQHK